MARWKTEPRPEKKEEFFIDKIYLKGLKENLTDEERTRWMPILQDEDRRIVNNNRRHRSHRSPMDTTIVDREPRKDEVYRTADLLKLSHSEDWNDIIYSQRPEDLHELVTDYPVSMALKDLTLRQKEVLLETVVYGTSTADLAARLGCSERNIRKIRQTALENVREAVTGRRELLDE